MGLLVEARQVSAIGPDGLLFTSVSTTIRTQQVVVISGPPDPERTALMLALCGRLALADGSLHTDPAYADRPVAAVLRDRIAVAQAAPWIVLDPHMRVREAIAERLLLCGKRMTVTAVHDACDLMKLDMPPSATPVRDLDPVERLLFSVALAAGQNADGIAVADVDAGFGTADRLFVRKALQQLTAAGKAVIATSADSGWGDNDIRLNHTPDGTESGSDDGGREGGDEAAEVQSLPVYVHPLGGKKRLTSPRRRRAAKADAARREVSETGAARREASETEAARREVSETGAAATDKAPGDRQDEEPAALPDADAEPNEDDPGGSAS